MRPSSADLRAAILADYHEGYTIRAIITEHSITKPTLYRILRAAGVSPRRTPGPAQRPERRCRECHVPTTAKSGTCRSCQDLLAIASSPLDDSLALQGGQWVLDRRARIMRWEAA